MLIIPTLLVLGSVLGLNMVGRWRGLPLPKRRWAILTFTVIVLTVLSFITPLWEMGGLWFYD